MRLTHRRSLTPIRPIQSNQRRSGEDRHLRRVLCAATLPACSRYQSPALRRSAPRVSRDPRGPEVDGVDLRDPTSTRAFLYFSGIFVGRNGLGRKFEPAFVARRADGRSELEINQSKRGGIIMTPRATLILQTSFAVLLAQIIYIIIAGIVSAVIVTIATVMLLPSIIDLLAAIIGGATGIVVAKKACDKVLRDYSATTVCIIYCVISIIWLSTMQFYCGYSLKVQILRRIQHSAGGSIQIQNSTGGRFPSTVSDT